MFKKMLVVAGSFSFSLALSACGALDPGTENNRDTHSFTVEDETDDVQAECPIEDCGPALEMPVWVCEDGSFAGNTGRCLKLDDGSCGWEILDCPEEQDQELCPQQECGPAPGMPAWECEDGSFAGNTGRCLKLDDGSCGWEILDCPEEQDQELCPQEECGPGLEMPAWECEDGSIAGNTGRCLKLDDGSCSWEIRACP